MKPDPIKLTTAEEFHQYEADRYLAQAEAVWDDPDLTLDEKQHLGDYKRRRASYHQAALGWKHRLDDDDTRTGNAVALILMLLLGAGIGLALGWWLQ